MVLNQPTQVEQGDSNYILNGAFQPQLFYESMTLKDLSLDILYI